LLYGSLQDIFLQDILCQKIALRHSVSQAPFNRWTTCVAWDRLDRDAPKREASAA